VRHRMTFWMAIFCQPTTINNPLPQGTEVVAKLDPRLAPADSIAQAAHYLKIPACLLMSTSIAKGR
jgi:hypothetical protein